MKQRKRRYYSEADKNEMWDRWQRGESMHQIAASFGQYHSSIQRIIYTTGASGRNHVRDYQDSPWLNLLNWFLLCQKRSVTNHEMVMCLDYSVKLQSS